MLSDHHSGGGYDNNRKNNFFVSIPRRNLDGHINRRGDSNYKNLFQRSKNKYRNRWYNNNNNYQDRGYCNNNNNYKRKRFYFHCNRNQETNSVYIKKEPISMDDDKMSSSVSNAGNKVSGTNREKPATRTSRNSNKIDVNDNKSEVITDDDKTEENLEIDTTRSGASSKTVENLNTPLKCKSSLVKGIDEMSDDEKISKWLQKHPANESLNNFSSISSYEDITSSPKRKIAEDFDSAYSDNDSDNVQNIKKIKFDPNEKNNNSCSDDKSEIVKSGCDEGLVADEVSKDDASNNNFKNSNTSSPVSTCTNTSKGVTGKGVVAGGKKIDIRKHKAFKMMKEYHSSVSKFSNTLRKNPPVKTPDKPKEIDREKRKSPELKRTTRSISLIEPKSPHHDRPRRSIDSKKCNELRTKSRQSSVASDRTIKRKRSRSKSIPPDKLNSSVEHVNDLPPSMPIITDRSRSLYDNDELLNLLEGCEPVDEKPLKFDGSIIDITSDDNDFVVVENDRAAADDIEVIEIDRDEKFEVSSANLEIEIIDMTAELNETSPKTETIITEATEEVCENLPSSVPEVIENNEIVKASEDHIVPNVTNITEEQVNTANNSRNSSVIVDSRAMTTPETSRNNVTPLLSPALATTPTVSAPSPAPIQNEHHEPPIIAPNTDVRTTSAIRVRDPSSLGATEPLSDEDIDAAAILNNEVFKSLIDTFYLFCSWYTLLERNVHFNSVLQTDIGKIFNRDLSLVLFDQLKNLVLRSSYEQLKSSITNLMMYTSEFKQLIYKTLYSKVREMCKATNSVMIPTNQPWIEDIFTQCIDKFKADTFVMENQVPVTPERVEPVVLNPAPPQHNPQYMARTGTPESIRMANHGIIRTVNTDLLRPVNQEMMRPVNPEVNRMANPELVRTYNHNRPVNPSVHRPGVPVSIAPQATSHPCSSPRQNVIEINKSVTGNPVQSLKDIRINNVNYHTSDAVNGPPNVNISMTGPIHQKSVPEPQYSRRPVELLSHLVNNTSLSRTPVQHSSKSPQQTPPNLHYPGYSNATKPSNPPGAYMPHNNDQRFTVTATNTYYPPLPASRANQPPPYPSYGNYDPGQYSNIQQQQYLNYQNQMRANHQQKQTTTPVLNGPPNANSPYSSILRSSLQPVPQIQPKPNAIQTPLNVHYPHHNSYIHPQQHGHSPPQYQRPQPQSMVNPTSNHPSQVRNHLRNHIELSTQQQIQQQQQHQQQQQQQHQQQQHIIHQQQQQHNLQKKPPQQSPQMQGPAGHPSQRPVAAYEIVPVPSSDTQFQLRLSNDLSSQTQHQPVPPSNQVTSTQERISPDSQTTRETHCNAVGVGLSNGGGANGGGVDIGGGCNQTNDSELSTMVKTLVRESLREYLPQMQQANLNETKKMARNMHNHVRNK